MFNLHILYVVHQFFPKGYTGTERLVLNLAKQMQRIGHCVEVLTYGIEENSTGFSFQDGIMYKRYIFQNVPVISIKHLKESEDMNINIYDDRLEKILKKFINRENFDIMHVAHPMRMGYAIKVAHSLNIPIILTLTDFWLLCPRGIFVKANGELCYRTDDTMKCVNECLRNFSRNKIQNRRDEAKEVFEYANCRVSATSFLQKLFELNGYSGFHRIKFGTDYGNVKPSIKKYSETDEITLGYLSSLQPHKGAHILLKAFLQANTDNIRLKIYGDYIGQPHYYKQLKEIVGDNKKVDFCGEYKYEDMAGIFKKIDMAVVPSVWWENSPLVLLGALAHKVPAIVSNLGGMTEVIIDGENGFSFEAGRVESLAEVIKKVGQNPAILNEMKNKIQHPPRIEEEAFEYEKLYLSLIADKGH